MRRILIVEDNADLALGLKVNLEVEGYEVDLAGEGREALGCALSAGYDLIVLDLMLPGMDGYQVLRELRERDAATPVLILSARGEEVDKVRGFRLGADDYVTKPFGLMELLARIEAVLRRTARTPEAAAGVEAAVEHFGEVEVDPGARVVRLRQVPVPLTPKAFDLLLALLRRGGRVATRQELMQEVWGHLATIESRTVDTHIVELRRKLEVDPGRPRHILTVWKTGYRLQR